jgi:hypothetical protein
LLTLPKFGFADRESPQPGFCVPMDIECVRARPLPTQENVATANRTAAPTKKNPDNPGTACWYGEPGEMGNNAISCGQIIERLLA